MKLSETPTQWLIIGAVTNSEWDSCGFILLDLDKEYTKMLKERSTLAKSFKENPAFYHLSFWGNPYGWYRGHEAYDDIMEKLSDGDISWSFVAFDDESEIETFIKPEQRIDCEVMRFFKDGSAQFAGYGKHTGEEFWTSEFPIEVLEEL